jgi:hypothetical protein
MNVVYFYRKSHTYYMYTYLISLFRLGCCSQIFGPWSSRERWLIYRWRERWAGWCVISYFLFIFKLILITAEWHTLVKMRLHTDSTLAWLDESTKAFGKQIRHFQSHTCSFFDTRELPQEEAARSRRQKKKKVSKNLPNLSPIALAPSTATRSADSYSTQPVWMLLLYLLLVLI